MSAILPGCEPFSHVASGTRHDRAGVLVVHGFTGNPSSMRTQAHAFADAGFHVEQPRLPGHGTSLDDMMTTDWSDWSRGAAEAYDRLADRAERIVVIGLSMGGTLTLWTGLQRQHDGVLAGLVCVNPATRPQEPEVVEMLREMLADGTTVMPAIGSDIADPTATEIAYEGTPVKQLLSLVDDGLTPITDRYEELTIPLLLYTSRQDHVVPPADSDHLADTYGGSVEHVWLERSFHVATQDHDRDTISAGAVDFARRVV